MLRWKRVEVSGGFLLLAAVLYYLDDSGLLPLALLACALHELGHYWTICLLGGQVVLLRLTCIGAELCLSARRPLSYGAQLFAALAGPVVNLLLALACAQLAGVLGEGFYLFAGMNLALGLFNLLPVAQLDGGRALKCLLLLLGTEEMAVRAVQLVSAVLAGGLLIGSTLLLWRGRANITLLLTAAWLAVASMPQGEGANAWRDTLPKTRKYRKKHS